MDLKRKVDTEKAARESLCLSQEVGLKSVLSHTGSTEWVKSHLSSQGEVPSKFQQLCDI